MDGLIVIDKPAGPTSHDVVARMRRALGERRIGHTGTLDPAATGVLALVLGRATRLAQFLSAGSKSYDAIVRFGFATDTGDAQGQPIGAVSAGPPPSRQAIEAALDAFRGTFLQQPPAFSAKRIGGARSHRLARAGARDTRLLPAPARVTVHRLAMVNAEADHVTLAIDCSAGFYVRALAHDLGERLGVGAHLAALRRTRAGDFTVDRAIPLETAERNPVQAQAAIIAMADMLPRLPAVRLTPDGVRRAISGCELGQRDSMSGESAAAGADSRVRLLDLTGALVGIARPAGRPGFLHPSVILM
jgi:tRNA pseudouridine55 synthase